MDFDFQTLSPGQRYKLLASFIVPRPIALVTSRDADGTLNAAPFSFFNCFGADPGLVILAVANRPEGVPKDTAANIETAREFVVNLVDEPMAERMNAAATDFPPGMDELTAVGFEPAPCAGTDVPRIADAPASYACKLHSVQHIGNNRVVLGEVHAATFRDGLIDPETFRVDIEQLTIVGRLASPGWYCKTTDRFELNRMSFEEWQKTQR